MGITPRSVLSAFAVAAFLACSAGADRREASGSARAGDTTGERDSMAAATGVAPPLASDATLTLLTAAPLTPTLRIAAESFAVREAVRVVIDTLPELRTGRPDTPAQRAADVVALQDAELVARYIARREATWWLPFAGNRVVVAWSDSARRPLALDSANWIGVLTRRTTRVGRADPATTALGVHTLLAMQLAERARGERGLATRLQKAGAASLVLGGADTLAGALRAGALDVIWTYESLARAEGLRYLHLGDDIDLGSAARAAQYAAATVRLPRAVGHAAAAGDTAAGVAPDSIELRGTTLRYTLTIPRQTRNLALAERFVRFLFAPEQARILLGGDFTLVTPLVAIGTGLPDAVVSVADSIVPPSDGDAPVTPRS